MQTVFFHWNFESKQKTAAIFWESSRNFYFTRSRLDGHFSDKLELVSSSCFSFHCRCEQFHGTG